ncbi:hypothetical protein [Methanocella sp. MCL-LM]|uniref:hypothetical protein n=1 Tax=Methanocella sp. MCL-LM TaxID=3412035 RepID=UPI003C761F2E
MNQRDKIIIILAVAAIVGSAIWAMSPYGQAQDTGLAASPAGTPSPIVGPTAYAPGGEGTAAPTIIVGTRTVSTPSPTPVTPTPTPAATVVPTTVAVTGQQGMSAQLVNYGTDKDTFTRGEQATGFVTIKNTGSSVINDVTTSVTASRAVPVVGQTTLGSKDYTFSNLNINPGETKRVEFKADIPAEYKGVSTAGDYTLQVTIRTGGTEIGSFSKTVKIA